MPKVKLLSFHDFSAAAALFAIATVPEGTAGWFETVALTTLAPGEEAVLAAAVDDGGMVQSALPLVRDRQGKLRSLTAPYTTLFAPAFPNATWARYLGLQFGSVVNNVLRLDALDPRDPGTRAFFEGLQNTKLFCARFGHFANWFEVIADFEEYWETRPAKLRSTFRRKSTALSKGRSAAFQFESHGLGLEKALAAYLEVYESSWKVAEPHPAFISKMVRRLSVDGTVRLATMNLDGTAIAAQVWLVRGTKATIFKLAHRQDAAKFSPGTLLTHWTLEKLCREEGIQDVDFGRGNDAYKKDWLSRSRQRYGVVAANWKSTAGIAAVVSDVLLTRLSNNIRSKSIHDLDVTN